MQILRCFSTLTIEFVRIIVGTFHFLFLFLSEVMTFELWVKLFHEKFCCHPILKKHWHIQLVIRHIRHYCFCFLKIDKLKNQQKPTEGPQTTSICTAAGFEVDYELMKPKNFIFLQKCELKFKDNDLVTQEEQSIFDLCIWVNTLLLKHLRLLKSY